MSEIIKKHKIRSTHRRKKTEIDLNNHDNYNLKRNYPKLIFSLSVLLNANIFF